MMRYWLALFVPLFVAAPPPAQAQSLTPTVTEPDPVTPTPSNNSRFIFLLWAQNIARATAETANGGLENYRAEAAMHGPTFAAPVTIADDGTLTFVFRGYRPWDIDAEGDITYTLESEVVITPTRQVELTYNGPLR